jgi:hypothetical protein
MDVVTLGTAGLRGWRTKAADAVAPPLARRLPLTEEQIRAALGVLFLALTVKYVAGTVSDLLRSRSPHR